MSWFDRIKPITLHQGSELPYVILEDGVLLCYDNFYSESENSRNDYNIAFTVNKNLLLRKSTNFYYINTFPITIPFEDIYSLNDCIINGKIIKSASDSSGEEKNVAIIREEYFQDINEDTFQELADQLDTFDHSFILVGEDISPEVRLLSDSAELLRYSKWPQICVTVADSICSLPRKYCWTKTIPDLNITCYGFCSSSEMDDVNSYFELIGINSFCINWSD